jgi:hypothetical protein
MTNTGHEGSPRRPHCEDQIGIDHHPLTDDAKLDLVRDGGNPRTDSFLAHRSLEMSSMTLRPPALIFSLVLSALMSTSLLAQERLVLNDDIDDPLRMEIVAPWYRSTVYASMPVDSDKPRR